MSEPVTKITTNSEPCLTMLLEKLRKSDWSSADCCVKDQPWLLQESKETARVSHTHCSIVPLVNSARISTYTEDTQTVLIWQL